METIVRHWHILRMIPRLPRKVEAGTIHRRLLDLEPASPVTKRTVERDLHTLTASFPLQFDGCKPQGWSWRQDAESLDVPGMDLTAALTFRMAEEYLSRLLPHTCLTSLSPHMKRARTLLGDPGHGGLADWPEKVKVVPRTQPLLPPGIEPEVMDVVYEALLRNRRFKGIYKRQGEGGKEMEVNPLGLVFNDPAVYLVGTCWDYQDVRLLALHRFATAELLDTPVSQPDDFDLQSYIDGGALGFTNHPGSKIRLKARFTCGAAAHLRESPLSADQKISQDGKEWVVVEANVGDTDQLRWWLLGFGPQVEVLAPRALREEFVEKMRTMGELYR